MNQSHRANTLARTYERVVNALVLTEAEPARSWHAACATAAPLFFLNLINRSWLQLLFVGIKHLLELVLLGRYTEEIVINFLIFFLAIQV